MFRTARAIGKDQRATFPPPPPKTQADQPNPKLPKLADPTQARGPESLEGP